MKVKGWEREVRVTVVWRQRAFSSCGRGEWIKDREGVALGMGWGWGRWGGGRAGGGGYTRLCGEVDVRVSLVLSPRPRCYWWLLHAGLS